VRTIHMYRGLEGSKGEGRKDGNIEDRVVPDVSLWNTDFSRCELFCSMYLQR
jgi:hypothetical protein